MKNTKSILENKNGNITIEQPKFNYFTRFEEKFSDNKPEPSEDKPSSFEIKSNSNENLTHKNKKLEEPNEPTDDGLFITSRVEEKDIPRNRFKRDEDFDKNFGTLPAPKRNTEFEPTYKDMISKLYSKTNDEKNIEQEKIESVTPKEEALYFADYESLKNYYKSHGILFKIYSRQQMDYSHNTNKLKTIINLIMTGLIGIGCALLYLIFSLTNLTISSTNFFYYVPAAFMALVVIFSFVREKHSEGGKPCQRYNAQIMWIIFTLAVLVIFSINICCGMFGSNLTSYSTTLFVPIFLMLAICPIRYYITDYIFNKYGK